MANKLKIYEVEYNGKIYEIEAEDGTPEEEIFSAVEGYTPEPTQAAPAPAPTGPSVTMGEGAGAVPVAAEGPAPVADSSEYVSEMGADRIGQGLTAKAWSQEDLDTYVNMTEDVNVPSSEIAKFVQQRGAVWNQDSEAALKVQRDAILAGKPTSRDVAYESLAPKLMAPFDPSSEPDPNLPGLVGDINAVIGEGAIRDNPMNMLVTAARDMFNMDVDGFTIDSLKQQFPDLDDDAIEAIHDSVIGEARRREKETATYQAEQRDVNAVGRFAANMLGGLSPVDLIPLGRGLTFGRRLAEGAAVNVALDAPMQAQEIAYGAQDEYSFEQTAMAAAAGAAFQGAAEGAARGGQAVANAVDQSRIRNRLPEPPEALTTFLDKRGSRKYEGQDKEVRTMEPEAIKAAQDYVAEITSRWTNAPTKIEIVASPKDIKDAARRASVDDDFTGAYLEDGTMILNMKNINSVAGLKRTLFHEALGHHGLSQKFGQDLTDELGRMYDEGSPEFKKMVDDWLEANPDAYANRPDRLQLGVEEVLAEMSEDKILTYGIADKVSNLIKKFFRFMGMDLNLSVREIKSILGSAHDSAIRGKARGDLSRDGTRYMMAGESADTRNVETLQYAKMMERKGIDVGPKGWTRQNTGWFKGPDGQWRFEISDQEAAPAWIGRDALELFHDDWDSPIDADETTRSLKILADPKAASRQAWLPLDLVLEHKKLFDAYPELADIKVYRAGMEQLAPDRVKGNRGFYDPVRNEIYISSKESDGSAISIILHEVQHAIQDIEGFASGGSGNTVIQQLPTDLLLKGSRQYVKWLATPEGKKIIKDDPRFEGYTPQNLATVIGKMIQDEDYSGLRSYFQTEGGAKLEAYNHLFGEIEARDTQYRQFMSDAERREIAPYEKEGNIDPESYVITHDDVGQAEATVYHGSPYDFDQFDHSKMGSGEGAQVYGWGTYLTETESVARGYKNTLSGRLSNTVLTGVDGKQHSIPKYYDKNMVAEVLGIDINNSRQLYPVEFALDQMQGGDTVEQAVQAAYDNYPHFSKLDSNWDLGLKNLLASGATVQNTGKLYHVDIPDDATWLLYDKSFDKQPKKVQELFKKLGFKTLGLTQYDRLTRNYINSRKAFDYARKARESFQKSREAALSRGNLDEETLKWAEAEGKTLEQVYENTRSEYMKYKEPYEKAIAPSHRGKGLYDKLVALQGSPKNASEFLAMNGITGTKYLDGFSRGAGDGTYNYVVYSDKTPKISAKYSKKRNFEQAAAAERSEIENAKEILTNILTTYEPETRTWEEGKQAARDRYIAPSTVRKTKGIENLDKKLFQYDAVAQRMSDRLSVLHAKMKDGTFTMADKARYLETLAEAQHLYARIFEQQSEIGRALNVFKALSFTRSKLASLNEVLAEMSDQGSGYGAFADEEVFMKFAKKMEELLADGNTNGAMNMVKQIHKPYWWQYLLSYRHSAMLSGIGTHAVNLMDSVTMIARELEETALALPGYAVRKGLQASGMNVKDGVTPQEVVARSYGLLRSALDPATYKGAAEAFAKGHGNREISSKVEMQDARIPVIGAIQDSLHATDVFFRSFHMNANLYSLGVRRAYEEGLRGKAAFEAGTAYAVNPDQGMLREARAMADTSLLVDTPSWIGQKGEAGKAIRPNMSPMEQLGAFSANFALPFFRVTDRLLFQKLRRVPILNMLDRVTREDWAAGGARRDIAIARTMYGGALIAYYWNAAGEEEVTGSGPSDYKKAAALMSGGWKPNSIKEGDTFYDASSMNLSATPWDLQNSTATNVASIRESWEKGKNADGTVRGLTLAFAAMMKELTAQSFAESLAPYVEAMSAGASEGSLDAAVGNLVGGAASAFVPASLRQANQMTPAEYGGDPIKRDATGDKSISGRAVGRVMSGIPGLSDNLPANYDNYGDEVPQGRGLLRTQNYSDLKQDEVARELYEVEKAERKTVVSAGPTRFTMASAPDMENEWVKVRDGEVKLKAPAAQEWQRLQGFYFREWMKDEISSPEWKKMTTEEKKDVIKDVMKDARKEAKLEMLPVMGLEDTEE